MEKIKKKHVFCIFCIIGGCCTARVMTTRSFIRADCCSLRCLSNVVLAALVSRVSRTVAKRRQRVAFPGYSARALALLMPHTPSLQSRLNCFSTPWAINANDPVPKRICTNLFTKGPDGGTLLPFHGYLYIT